jgi:hypothetical protein
MSSGEKYNGTGDKWREKHYRTKTLHWPTRGILRRRRRRRRKALHTSGKRKFHLP